MKRASQKLGRITVTADCFEQRLAQSLRDGAMRLAMQDHRVDRAPDVVHSGPRNDVDLAGLRIDFDFADMASVGIAADPVGDVTDTGQRATEIPWHAAGGGCGICNVEQPDAGTAWSGEYAVSVQQGLRLSLQDMSGN